MIRETESIKANVAKAESRKELKEEKGKRIDKKKGSR